jgi:hypothetical protein
VCERAKRVDEQEVEMTPVQRSEYNMMMALVAIYRFGWLRAREVGNILWANSPTRNVQGARLCEKLLQCKPALIVKKRLPGSAGPVYVLSQAGAQALIDSELVQSWDKNWDAEKAVSGKKIGDHIDQDLGKFVFEKNGKEIPGHFSKKKGRWFDLSSSEYVKEKIIHKPGPWIPTKTWQHDLLSNSFLTLMWGLGFEVISEREIRRKNPNFQVKVPDGLLRINGEWIWVEVERAKKSGRHMRDLVATFVTNHAIGDIVTTSSILVFEEDSSHMEKVSKAIKECMLECHQVVAHFQPVKLQSDAVVSLSKIQSKTFTKYFEGDIDDYPYYDLVLTNYWEPGDFFHSFILKIPDVAGRAFEIRLTRERSINKSFWFCRYFELTSSEEKHIGSADSAWPENAEILVMQKSSMYQIFECSTFMNACHANQAYVQEKNTKLILKIVEKLLPAQDLSYVFQLKPYAQAVNIIAHKIKDQVPDFKELVFSEKFAHNETWYTYEYFRMSDEC